jgi:hypothetical protein
MLGLGAFASSPYAPHTMTDRPRTEQSAQFTRGPLTPETLMFQRADDIVDGTVTIQGVRLGLSHILTFFAVPTPIRSGPVLEPTSTDPPGTSPAVVNQVPSGGV